MAHDPASPAPPLPEPSPETVEFEAALVARDLAKAATRAAFGAYTQMVAEEAKAEERVVRARARWMEFDKKRRETT